MMAKVLHITNTNLDWDYRIVKELNVLSKTDFNIYAFGIELDNFEAKKTNIESSVNYFNLKMISTKLNNFLPRFIYYIFFMAEFTFKGVYNGLKIKPKAIHCHDSIALFVGYLISLFIKTKLIYDAHELNNLRFSPNYILKLNKIIEKIAWSRIDLLISVSQGILDYYCFSLGEKETLLVPNCNEFSETTNNKKIDLKLKYNVGENLLFVFVGAFSFGRGIRSILDVFSNKNVKNHVVFIGYGELESSIISYAKNKNIHFHGSLNQEELIHTVRSADCGLCLIEPISYSDYLSMPNKLYDYVNSGIPIVCSDLPELSRTVLNHNIGFITKSDNQSLIKLFSNLTITELNSKTITASIKYKLSWKYNSSLLIKKYQQILN
mgnify:CR=1 FL=1